MYGAPLSAVKQLNKNVLLILKSIASFPSRCLWFLDKIIILLQRSLVFHDVAETNGA